MRKVLSFCWVLLLMVGTVNAQVGQGGIKGKVTDDKGEPIPFANVVVKMGGNLITGTQTDFDGLYTIKPLQPGNYDIEASFVGFQSVQIKGVIVKSDKLSFQDLKLSSGAIDLTTVQVFDYAVPLIDKDNTAGGETVTRDDIDKLPGRSATDVTKTVGGIYSRDDGQGGLNSRGARDDANFVFIDGVKVRGTSNLPKAALEQVSVVTGGVPAQYGDVTGAVISITTRGAAREFSGGVDYLTSGYKIGEKMYGLDPMGYNLLEFNATGPLIWKKDSAGNKKDPILGFFIAGNANHTVDPLPSAIGMWKVKDDVLENLNKNPLRFNPNGSGTFLNHEFIRLNDLEKINTRLNVQSQVVNLNVKFDLNLSKNTTLTFGGTFDYNKGNNDRYRNLGSSELNPRGNLYNYTLMNWHHNPQIIDNTYRIFGRLTQRFANSTSGASNIKNIYYTIQADYQKSTSKSWDENLRDNLFAYGYYGSFKTYQTRNYAPGQDSLTGLFGLIHQTFEDTLVAFTPDYTYNPEAAQMTQAFYDLYGWQGFDEEGNPIYDKSIAGTNLSNLNNIALLGGLRNGDAPRDIYNMWRTPAYVNNNYYLNEQEQYRLTGIGSADIGNHAITVGFEYEQRIDREFNMGDPQGLWTVGRLYTNRHILELDKSNPIISQIGTFPQIDYNRLNGAPDSAWGGSFNGEDPQSFFDFNLRNKLGLNPDGTDWIDFDSYSPETFSLDMFSADEILNSGSPLATYFGYDHTGKKVKNYSSDWLTRFFTDRDQYGNYIRAIAPFQPIYVAGFIQDKFAFDDLVFNVGIRVDRYDANQKVLNDPYVFFPTVKAGEDLSQYGLQLGDYTIPSNIGSDYVVYVDNVQNPTSIVGYRNGDTWYNASGIEIQDASILVGPNNKVSPLLVDKERTNPQDITESSFRDYRPRTAIMPRISFSFPVSDEALFFAHYDVLTKRPGSFNRLDPTDYFFINAIGSGTVNNPDLGLEQTIDYEVGFKQKLNNYSALTLTSFYREFRNLLQVINYQQAYPNQYITFINADFGTVKGFTFSYDLRRMGNIRGRVSYTLQFAEGTGSSSTSGLGLARSGKPNLRTLIPLSFDQRHTIIANLDYRYGSGADYNGPQGFMRKILENAGANAIFNLGSGTPYSGQQNITSEALFTQTATFLDGQLNGNRLPWNFVVNMGVDKGFDLKWGKQENGTYKKTTPLLIYTQIENLFNTLNIRSVYRATGNPDDDGYLTAAQFQNDINSTADPVSFRELYSLKVNNPAFYTLPRRFKIGIRLDF